MGNENKDRCFVITPIGDKSDPIRRHIDGIIDAAIIPALGNKYEVIAPHRISEPRTITKKVIEEIYSAKLVVANVTGLNPNVMYELALRHAIGKPVIIIVEYGTKLPFDISVESVIYYQNDAQGVLDLKEDLINTETKIDFSQIFGPIFDVIGNMRDTEQMIKVAKETGNKDIEPLTHILNLLDRMENKINRISDRNRLSHSALPTVPEPDSMIHHNFLFSFTIKPQEYSPNGLVAYLNKRNRNENFALGATSIMFILMKTIH